MKWVGEEGKKMAPGVWQLSIKGSEIFNQGNCFECGLQPLHGHICLTWHMEVKQCKNKTKMDHM